MGADVLPLSSEAIIVFEAGATLFSGFSEGQALSQMAAPLCLAHPNSKRSIPQLLEAIGWVLELIPESGKALCEDWSQRFPTHRKQFELFSLQRRVADALWPLFDDPSSAPALWQPKPNLALETHGTVFPSPPPH